jgi:HD-like signal output (HDOD) protein
MRHKSDFPALSESVACIQRVANSEKESLGSLSAEILKDVALTNKLLRMVNTAHYVQAGGGSISTVSRAVALVGFAGIRNMALSLVLLEHMQDKQHASHLKEEFLRSLLAGSLASELSAGSRDGEEAFIGALFQNLGRLLTRFYFPEEAQQVERAMTQEVAALSEEAASIQALGMSYEDLGVGVARSWGLPETLQRCMRRPRGEPPTAPPPRTADRLRWVTVVANELATTLQNTEPERAEAAVAAVAERFSRVLGVSVGQIQVCTRQAREQLRPLAHAMGLGQQSGVAARRLLDPLPQARMEGAGLDDTLTLLALHATLPLVEAPSTERGGSVAGGAPRPEQSASMMAAGIQDITNAMVEDFKLNEVLRMILETMLRSLCFQRVLFCLRDPKTDTIVARFGLGAGVEAIVPHFRVAMKVKDGSDLFAAVCLKGADTLITNAAAPSIAARLPAWFNRHVGAPAFLLLPLAIKGSPFALIYADMAHAGGIDLGEKELSLLRTLRNQAVMAFRQAS